MIGEAILICGFCELSGYILYYSDELSDYILKYRARNTRSGGILFDDIVIR
jgi:hypothetical protein